jgi:hypothetical protein
MKFAAALLVLLSTLSVSANAKVMFTNDAENSTRVIASSTSGKNLTPAQPLVSEPATVQPMVAAAMVKLKPEQPHRFVDRTNSFAFAALAASLTADALSTQRGLAYPNFHEMNPIARPFVQTRTGAAFYTAGSFAFLTGGMYLAHKTNHHKLEKITPFVISGWEAFLAARNYHLISIAARQH